MIKSLRALRDEYLRLDPERIRQERLLAAEQERDEQFEAQVALISCKVALHTIKQGLANTVSSTYDFFH